eukprot:748896-Hanusia_phi.AAC.2
MSRGGQRVARAMQAQVCCALSEIFFASWKLLVSKRMTRQAKLSTGRLKWERNVKGDVFRVFLENLNAFASSAQLSLNRYSALDATISFLRQSFERFRQGLFSRYQVEQCLRRQQIRLTGQVFAGWLLTRKRESALSMISKQLNSQKQHLSSSMVMFAWCQYARVMNIVHVKVLARWKLWITQWRHGVRLQKLSRRYKKSWKNSLILYAFKEFQLAVIKCLYAASSSHADDQSSEIKCVEWTNAQLSSHVHYMRMALGFLELRSMFQQGTIQRLRISLKQRSLPVSWKEFFHWKLFSLKKFKKRSTEVIESLQKRQFQLEMEKSEFKKLMEEALKEQRAIASCYKASKKSCSLKRTEM